MSRDVLGFWGDDHNTYLKIKTFNYLEMLFVWFQVFMPKYKKNFYQFTSKFDW